MKMLFSKFLVAIVLMFLLGTSTVFATVRVTPVKQYLNNVTFSCWYAQLGKQLSPEFSGKLYGKEYRKQYEAWKQVEGFTAEKQVNRNNNAYLTIPVSGELAKQARYVVVISDQDTAVSQSVVVDGRTYVQSTLEGAEKLYYEVGEGVAIPKDETPPPVEAVLTWEKLNVPEDAIASSLVTKPLVIIPSKASDFALEDVSVKYLAILEDPMWTGIFLLFGFLLINSMSSFIKASSPPANEIAEGDEVASSTGTPEVDVAIEHPIADAYVVFLLSHEDMLEAVIASGVLDVVEGNKVKFAKTPDGTQVVFPKGVLVNNVPKNIYAAINQLLADNSVV